MQQFKQSDMKTMHKIAGILLLAAVLGLSSCGPKLPPLPASAVAAYFVGAAKTKAIDTSYYQVKDAHGEVLGTVLFSSPYSDHVKGFNGPTPLLITLDPEDRIQNVILLENQETPEYAMRVIGGGFYNVWNGLTVDEALRKDVDAISGATYTSNSMKNSLKVRLVAYLRQKQK